MPSSRGMWRKLLMPTLHSWHHKSANHIRKWMMRQMEVWSGVAVYRVSFASVDSAFWVSSALTKKHYLQFNFSNLVWHTYLQFNRLWLHYHFHLTYTGGSRPWARFWFACPAGFSFFGDFFFFIPKIREGAGPSPRSTTELNYLRFVLHEIWWNALYKSLAVKKLNWVSIYLRWY